MHWGWHLVRAPAAFADHGYCASDPWIVTYKESKSKQGNENGTLHPNQTGQTKIANAVYTAVEPVVLAG